MERIIPSAGRGHEPNRIVLNRTASGWMARYVGPHAAGIVELFGVDTIPTAFTASAEAETVLATLKPRHEPDVRFEVHR